VLWPEVEGLLAHRRGWLAEHAPDLGYAPRLDPHILGVAKDLLVQSGVLRRETSVLLGREVTAYLDGTAEAERRATEVERLAATKRRLYRSFLGWTSDAKLCGGIAERHVAATLDNLRGQAVWLEPKIGAGEARTIDGQKISGGLDHAGHLALDPANPGAGFVPFVIEDKNVRQTIYPHHVEVWDLLCKAGHFPNRVPILIAPRFHHTTYVLFAAIGAIAIQTTQQWFAPDPAIETARFTRIVKELSLIGATQLLDPDRPSKLLRDFFTTVVHKRSEKHPDSSLIEFSGDLWSRAAPICARYAELRNRLTSTLRRETYRQFLDELYAEGFAVEELLPRHAVEGDAHDEEWIDSEEEL
jgi:hypothetical protein